MSQAPGLQASPILRGATRRAATGTTRLTRNPTVSQTRASSPSEPEADASRSIMMAATGVMLRVGTAAGEP
jgi:hypothetical protein